jgi:transcriptional antiterminator RfaH
MRHWFAARTKIGKEVQASVNVASMEGFDVFLPVAPVQRKHARKTETVNKPLYPRYLFIAFDPDLDRHGAINNCRGVASRGLIVTASGRPKPIPDTIIQQIRDREAAALAVIGEATTGYKPGDTFELKRGHFATMTATYMGEDRGRVWATVELFGRGHMVDLEFEEVPRRTLDTRVA